MMQEKNYRYKILIIPGIFPFPPKDGGRICIYSFIEFLQQQHQIHLFTPVSNRKEMDLVQEYKNKLPSVVFHTPEFITETQNSLFIKFSSWCKKNAIHIKNWMTKKKAGKNSILNFKTNPSELYEERYINELLNLFEGNVFDIIQTEHTPALNLITIFPSHSKKIFVSLESLHSIINDYANLAQNIHKKYIRYIAENSKSIEYSFMEKYDAVFTLNQADCDEIKKQLPKIKVFNSPFPVLNSDILKVDIESFFFEKLVFLGGENHYPNLDAMEWFIKEVMPQIKNAHNLKLYITGSWQTKTIKYFKKINSNVVFTGFIDSINLLLKNSISIVPIRLGGGGLRSKIITSMASGAPIVTTSLACTGLEAAHGKQYLIADSSKDFADAIESLIDDEKIATTLIKNSTEYITSNFTQKVLSEKRNEFYDILVHNQ